jgi:hypothetical protein
MQNPISDINQTEDQSVGESANEDDESSESKYMEGVGETQSHETREKIGRHEASYY